MARRAVTRCTDSPSGLTEHVLVCSGSDRRAHATLMADTPVDCSGHFTRGQWIARETTKVLVQSPCADAAVAAPLISTGVSRIVALASKIEAYAVPPNTPPTMGAAQNSQSWAIAHPPTTSAGPVLRAGFTERFVTGMPMR